MDGIWYVKSKSFHVDGTVAKNLLSGVSVVDQDMRIGVVRDTLFIESLPFERALPFVSALPVDSMKPLPNGFEFAFTANRYRQEKWTIVFLSANAWKGMRLVTTRNAAGDFVDTLSGSQVFEARKQPEIIRKLEGVWEEQWSLSQAFEPGSISSQVRRYSISRDTINIEVENEIGNFDHIIAMPIDAVVVGPKGFVFTFAPPDALADRRKMTFTNLTAESWNGRMDITKVSKGGAIEVIYGRARRRP